jgi:hypothetical protein
MCADTTNLPKLLRTLISRFSYAKSQPWDTNRLRWALLLSSRAKPKSQPRPTDRVQPGEIGGSSAFSGDRSPTPIGSCKERATASTHAPPSLYGVDPESRPSGCSARSQAAQRSVRTFSATIRVEDQGTSSLRSSHMQEGPGPHSARWRSLDRPDPSKHSLTPVEVSS